MTRPCTTTMPSSSSSSSSSKGPVASTTRSTSGTVSSFDSEWETLPSNPLDTVRVFDSFKDPQHCGCTLPLRSLVTLLQNCTTTVSSPTRTNQKSKGNATSHQACCPRCQSPIVYVQDGLVSKKEQDTVVFKYGKQVYEVTVGQGDGMNGSVSSVNNTNERPWWMWWIPFGDVVFANHRSESQTTAQGRIAQVLGMNDIKILSKGKVIYPPTTTSNSKDDNDEVSTSQKLLQVSSAMSSSKKVSLLVMGTAIGHELQEPDKKHEPSSNSSWFSMVMGLGHRVFWSSIHWVQYILEQIHANLVQPLLLTHRSNNNSRGTHTTTNGTTRRAQ